jgi:beta-phosphoglucomutase-like phosphatase (HAD superfamily)
MSKSGANRPDTSRASPDRPPVAALIFDIDGTIIDSMPYHGRSWPIMLARHGVGDEHMALIAKSAGRRADELMRDHFGADIAEQRERALDDEKG